MRKKINIQLIGIALLSMLLTMVLLLFVYYGIFRKQVLDELKTIAHMMGSMENLTVYSVKDYQTKLDNIRITLLDTDGSVLYDSNANAAEMDNHALRPEISEAYTNGEGYAIRESDTLSQNTYYYAILLNNGGVLRVAKEASSILSIFASSLPSLLIIIISLTIVCTVVARLFTKSLMKPIDNMAKDLDHMGEVETYSELEPFIDTIQRQHEDILKNAKLRQEFTANVSHELKTPLTVISGYSELIENGMTGEEDTIRFSREIHRNSTRLLTLINDILRLSELDSGEPNMLTENVDLYEIADNCISMLQINAEKHNVSLHLYGPHIFIQANRQMLEEMIYNLCDNGIRYNEPGGKVEISIKENAETIILMVSDTGIGISEKNQERIFERFYRVDKSRSKKTGGTGLGLAIVKHIAERMDAKIQLDSELGKGTTITILFAKPANHQMQK